MKSKQPEALRLADELERDKWHGPAVVMQAAADELRRLHAENTALQSGYDAARLEIASLQAEVARYRESMTAGSYAGCVVWAGDYRVMQLMSETEVRAWRFSCDPLKHLAEVCASELANHWKKQAGETP